MRLPLSILIFLILLIISSGAGQQATEEGDLTVIINGLDNDEGVVKIALNNSQKDYETNGQAYRGREIEINEKTAKWTFEKILFGEYAIKVYHDEDNDDDLGTNFLGIPNEEYGFSNDASGTFGPASWEDAKFLFNSVNDTLHIRVD
jgi:uncharacterized protein (DUF2141 family)